jgi:rhodanese-related sulfurtransferase
MITIHPFGLATLIDNREPLDLIDVRTEKEFKSFHIAGARSVPLKKLSAPKVLQDRKSATTEPLYIIGDGRVRASLAAGILTGGGRCQAVILDGGMDAWISQGLSVVRKKHFWNFPPTLLKQCRCDGDDDGVSLFVRKAAEGEIFAKT